MSNSAIDCFSFWGKAQPRDPAQGPKWHPLPFHCLDVAAVGEVLLRHHKGLSSNLSRLLSLPQDQTVELVCFLLALHDIGKFAKKFQAKVPKFFPKCFTDDPARLATSYDHAAGGLRLYNINQALFCLSGGIDSVAWRPCISAVVGHHGSPPEVPFNDTVVKLKEDYGDPGFRAAEEFVRLTLGLFALPPAFTSLDPQLIRRASYALAGLAVLADWIGSNQRWFPYRAPTISIEDYWSETRKRAEHAVETAGVLPADAADSLSYQALIGPHAELSPMQERVQSVEIPSGPTLFILEDETGSGKTEAALMLAHRLMASDRGEERADGLYVALPTMATANAMFDRLAKAYRSLFAEGSIPSIVLAHGARGMHTGFRSATLDAARCEKQYSQSDGGGDDSDTTASAACAAWIADDRRRSFLADAGAGTVDQALLSVLPSRHQSLRLLGLIRRVLILDEVHAYDAYMQREIETLLEFQAGLGGSAILLSATLPASCRRRLTNAFAKGLGKHGEALAPSSMSYPMMTVCAADRQVAFGVRRWKKRSRKLPVRFLRNVSDALARVKEAAQDKKAVLYIRNTVDDALDAHACLREMGIDAELFHARFALVDRLNIEKHVTQTFGKRSEPAKRAGRVLIATQVVEQSLDLDFDVLISDLAPIDLLIQRAGRLWRHERHERTGHPELLVVGPESSKSANSDWFSEAFPRAAFVYPDHARLWLTANTLEQAGAIDSPRDLRRLIEAVYGEAGEERVPEPLRSKLWDAEGRTGAERGMANINSLKLSKGYTRQGGMWGQDFRTPTRLDDDPQVTVRLARLHDGGVRAYAPEEAPDEPWRAWRLSEVSVSARKVHGEADLPEHETVKLQAKKAAWTRYDADKILIVLEESHAANGTLLGYAASKENKRVVVSYNIRKGLEVHKTGPIILPGIVP